MIIKNQNTSVIVNFTLKRGSSENVTSTTSEKQISPNSNEPLPIVHLHPTHSITMASLATKLASASLNRTFVTLPAGVAGVRTVLGRSVFYSSDDDHHGHGHHDTPATPTLSALKVASPNNNRSFITGMCLPLCRQHGPTSSLQRFVFIHTPPQKIHGSLFRGNTRNRKRSPRAPDSAFLRQYHLQKPHFSQHGCCSYHDSYRSGIRRVPGDMLAHSGNPIVLSDIVQERIGNIVLSRKYV